MYSKKLGLGFYSIILTSILFVSCDFETAFSPDFDAPIKDFLEYWSENVTLARYEPASPHTQIGNLANLSASDSIEIKIFLTNPKSYNLELGKGTNPYFSILDSGGNDVALSKSASLSSDKSVITLTAKLSDATEKQNLTIDGHFYVIKGVEKFDQSYSFSFRQNTTPDIPANVNNPVTAETDGYHCLHFNYPDQSLNRNQNLQYQVSCYRFEKGKYNFIGQKNLTVADSKSSSSTEFIYYFSNQEKPLQYDYVVTAINPDGLKSETVSTSPALGISYVLEPTISFGSNGEENGLTAEKDGESYKVIEYSGSSLSVTATNNTEDSVMEVKINGETSAATSTLSNGFNTISVMVSKNLSRPVTVTKKVYVTKQIQTPEIKFYKNETDFIISETNDIEESGYTAYKCYNLPLTKSGTGKVNFEVTAGSGETVIIKEDGLEITAADNGKRFLETLGPHILSISVSKANCLTKSFTAKVYVQGILENPTLDFTTKGNGTADVNDSSGNPVYKFSYLSYAGLKFAVTEGNTGNDFSVKIGTKKDDLVSITADSNKLYLITHGTAATKKVLISIVQTRSHCKTNTYERTVVAKIKPVTVKFKDDKIIFRGDDEEGGSGIELRGTIYAETSVTAAKKLWTSSGYDNNKKGIGNSTNETFSFSNISLMLNSPDDKFYIWTDDMYDVDTGWNGNDWLGKIEKGKKSASYRKLSALKTNKNFTKVFGDDKTKEEDDWFNLTFELVLSDD